MSNIVIAFPKQEVSQNLKRILMQSGYHVQAVCATGAQVLACMEGLESGIVVCGARFADMMYTELHEYLPKGFQMLLIASAAVVREREIDQLVCLAMPMKVHELLETLAMMEEQMRRERKRRRGRPKARSEEDRALIESAKALLMERNGFSEEEAHRYIQKRSMENGTGLVEVSQMILSLMK